MSNTTLAKEIVNKVGGKENIVSLVHCATRLRFKLKNKKNADRKSIEEMEGVMTVVESGGQFQVVIGNEVSNIYKEIVKIADLNNEVDSKGGVEEKTSVVSKIFEFISGSFSPLIPALAGAGMLKALLTVMTSFGWLSTETGTYAILSAAGNSIFYFLPVMLGFTCARALGANVIVGATIGAALLEPNFTGLMAAGQNTDFMGMTVVLMDYSSSVFPIFIAIAIYALFEKGLKKIVHKDLQLFLIPMLSLMVMVPLTVMTFGPFGVNVGNVLASGITFISSKSSILAGAVLGGCWLFLVIFGLHWATVPLVLGNIAAGGDPIIAMAAGAPFATVGLALGILVKAKDKKIKALAGSTLLPGLLAGVNEPIIYGLMLPFRRTIAYVVIGGAVGGVINGVLGVKQITFALPSILATASFSPVSSFLIGISASVIVTALLTIILGYENKSGEVKEIIENKTCNKNIIASPIEGEIVELCNIEDPVFSTETMGKGVAIEPIKGEVLSPVDGTITALFPTGHAVGITSNKGVEILIHIGMDTTQLDGKYFETLVKSGDKVKQGDLLVKFDIQKIKEEGYKVTTPVIITNTQNYLDVVSTAENNTVQSGEDLLVVLG